MRLRLHGRCPHPAYEVLRVEDDAREQKDERSGEWRNNPT